MRRVSALDRSLARARKLRIIIATPSYRRALRYGVAASTEHQNFPFSAAIRTVLDVGANKGQFALIASNRWPSARLICFEPLTRPVSVLRRVLRHHRDVEIVNAAVAASTGTATMHVSRDDNSSSLLAITDRQLEAFPRTEEVAAVEVRTVSLDEAVGESIERPALLKLDVQGSELEVLRGANRLLSAIDVVLVECSFEKFYADQPRAEHVVRFLHGRGFVLSGGTAPALDRRGVILQLDLIFTRARHDRPSAATT